jgi:hypothetical protein
LKRLTDSLPRTFLSYLISSEEIKNVQHKLESVIQGRVSHLSLGNNSAFMIGVKIPRESFPLKSRDSACVNGVNIECLKRQMVSINYLKWSSASIGVPFLTFCLLCIVIN